MKQAILITAYTSPELLEQLVDYFDDDFEIFIHIDRKSKADFSALNGHRNVHLFKRYKVEWGDSNHLRAILMLMRVAFNMPDLEYFHLITGSDYPCMSSQEFKKFCELHRQDNFVEYFRIPHHDWGQDGGRGRLDYYWIRPSYRASGSWFTRKFINLQRRLGWKRRFHFFDGNIYGGSTYWSVSREAIHTALKYIDEHPAYLRRFRMTNIAEEFCLPTIWANSGLKLTNNYMRYINWGEDGYNPQVLTENDWSNITLGKYFFARKMESGTSDRLIKLIQTSQERG